MWRMWIGDKQLNWGHGCSLASGGLLLEGEGIDGTCVKFRGGYPSVRRLPHLHLLPQISAASAGHFWSVGILHHLGICGNAPPLKMKNILSVTNFLKYY